MKNFNLSTFWGCCIISIGIVVAGWLISKELPDTAKFPSNLAVTTTNVEYGGFGDYLSTHEVAAYLGVTDEDVAALMNVGELDSVCTKINANYVFSKEALKEWIDSRIKN